MANNYKQVHKRSSLAYRKGKTRLRPLSLKQLTDLAAKEKSGKHYDAVAKEIARKTKMGMFWHQPEPLGVSE